MTTCCFPFEFGVSLWEEREDEVSVELSDEDARTLYYCSKNNLGFSFKDYSSIQDDFMSTKDIYDVACRAAEERIKELAASDPSIAEPFLVSHGYSEPGQPITSEQIERYVQEGAWIEVKFPTDWDFK